MEEESKSKLKKAMLSAGEEHLLLMLDHVYEIGQVYVDETSNPLDNTLLEGLKLLKGLLSDAIDKVDGEEG